MNVIGHQPTWNTAYEALEVKATCLRLPLKKALDSAVFAVPMATSRAPKNIAVKSRLAVDYIQEIASCGRKVSRGMEHGQPTY